MRRYYISGAAVCAAVMISMSGCGSASGAESQAAVDKQETAQQETMVVETVEGPIESMEEPGEQAMAPVRIFGPVARLEDGRLSIDNQSSESSTGEIILNVSQESTYILDGASGMPVNLDDIKDGDVIYVYIGPAMTMSLPPMTNADVIFVGEAAEQPEYAEIQSVVTNGETSQTVLTTTDGTEYPLTDECEIVPYLTRNIVTLDDLTKGHRVVIWTEDSGQAEKIMVFAE